MTQLLYIRFNQEPGIMPSDPIGWQVQNDAGPPLHVQDRDLITCRAWEIDLFSDILIVPSGAATAQCSSDFTMSIGLSIDWPAFLASDFTFVTIAQHGDSTNSTWRLSAEIVNEAAQTVQFVLSWRNAAATAWRIVGGPIVKMDRPAILFVSRERTATGFTVRWSINGESAGMSTGHPLDIVVTSGGTGEVTIGHVTGGLEVAVGWRLEWIQVLDDATTIDEMNAIGKRFAIAAPNLTTAIRRLQPEDVYSRNPASLIDREIRVEGVAASFPRGAADYLLASMPAGRSFGPMLERWENVLRPGTAPGADLATRQAALAAQLRLSGSAIDEIKIALEPVLGLTSADIVIDELDTNEYLEEFNTTVTSGGYFVSGYDASRWVTVGAARFTFTHVGGSSLFRITRTLASDDMRYLGRMSYALADQSTPFHLHPTVESGRDTWWEIHIAALTLPATNILAGLVIGDVEADDWTWIGIYNNGATNRRGWVRYGNHLMGSINDIALQSPITPLYIRVRDLGGGSYELRFSNTDPADWTVIAPTVITGATPRARWGGLGIAGSNTSASGAITFDAGRYFDRSIYGPGRLSWQAFRNPGLAGTYDLQAADLVIQRVSPTHVEGAPITHRNGLHVDDATTLLDRDPMRT